MYNLAFDIGNILVSVDLAKFTNELDKYINKTDRAFNNSMFFLEHLQTHQEIGLTTVARALKIEYDFQDEVILKLLDAWNEVIVPNDMMLDMLDELKKLGVKIALLSNIGEEHTKFLAKSCPRLFNDNVLWLSCEVGARKPSKLFFQSFLIDHPEFKNCPFVDDRKENLITAQNYCFNPVLFNLENVMKLKKPNLVIDHLKQLIKEELFKDKFDKRNYLDEYNPDYVLL